MSLLADSLLKVYSKPFYAKQTKGFARDIALSRKFSLDAEASCFILDVMDSAVGPKAIMDLCSLSKLPYDLTWIEYDGKARNLYACEKHGVDPKEFWDSPAVNGYLCKASPDGIFCATECFSHGFGADGKPLWDKPTPYYLSMLWRTEPGPLPVKGIGTSSSNPAWGAKGSRIIKTAEEALSHIDQSQHPVSVVFTPYFDPDLAAKALYQETFPPEQHKGALKFLWAILATINQVPVEFKEVRPSKGQMVAGSYKKFMEHKVVSLTIPAKRYNTLKKIVSSAKRRAHQVRGFWRKPRPNQKKQELTWIASHQRGDASIGFVTHDYEVKHD